MAKFAQAVAKYISNIFIYFGLTSPGVHATPWFSFRILSIGYLYGVHVQYPCMFIIPYNHLWTIGIKTAYLTREEHQLDFEEIYIYLLTK